MVSIYWYCNLLGSLCIKVAALCWACQTLQVELDASYSKAHIVSFHLPTFTFCRYYILSVLAIPPQLALFHWSGTAETLKSCCPRYFLMESNSSHCARSGYGIQKKICLWKFFKRQSALVTGAECLARLCADTMTSAICWQRCWTNQQLKHYQGFWILFNYKDFNDWDHSVHLTGAECLAPNFYKQVDKLKMFTCDLGQ